MDKMRRKSLRGYKKQKRMKRHTLRKYIVVHDEIQLDQIDSHSLNVHDEIQLDQIDSHSSDGFDVSQLSSTSSSSPSEFSYHSSDALSSSLSSSSYDDDSSENAFCIELEHDEDLQSHFKSKLCTKSLKACKTLQLRIASLCSWYCNQSSTSLVIISDANSTQTKHTTYSVFYELIYTNYQDLVGFYSFLTDIRMFKASTICNYNEDVSYFANWFVSLRRSRNTLFKLGPQDLYSIRIVFHAMRKCYKKCSIKERIAAPNSIRDLINNQKWPEGGLQDLYNAVVAEMSWLNKVLEQNNNAVNRITYGRFMELLVSSAYVCSIQGRVRALNDLQLKDYDTLLNGYVMSGTFKTSHYFGLQPVTTSDLFRYLLKVYMEMFRTNSSHSLPSDPLFLSYDNSPLRVGRCVTSFFNRTLNLHITTNTIRSIIETSTEDLHLNGEISNAERSSILNINGHSGETMRKFYLKRDRERDITHATDVFGKIVTHHECSPILPNALSFNDQRRPDTFGCADKCDKFVKANENISLPTGYKHEYFDRSNLRRIPWSAYEVDYISKWCSQHGDANNVMARCLERIRSDKEALQHFHPHHIQNSSRLRYGYEIWKRQNDK
jgi:hypothetical protein